MRFWWCGVLLIVCAGCWQEVYYDPSKPAVITPVVGDVPEVTSETKAEVAGTQDPPIDERNAESAEVTADELFGMPEAATSTEDAATTTDSADVSQQESSEQAGPESQMPTDTPTDLADEQPVTPESAEPLVASDDPPPDEAATNADPISGNTEVMRPSRTALAVWRMSSRWSFAAAIYGKGQPEDRYRDSLEQATYAAELVGVELPTFPVTEGISLEAAVIGYLLDAGPAAFVNKLSEDFVPEYEALAELAIRTNALLLVYTPKSQQLDSLISSIRHSAEKSGLPTELWMDLIAMIERREPFADVKQRVLAFHNEVSDYLAGEE